MSFSQMLSNTVAKVQRLWRWLSGAHRFDKLPVLCGARDPSNNRPVAILRGEMGYFLWAEGTTPEEWNNDRNISPDQVKAMIAGSVLGWHGNQTESTVRSK
jgi:hypothetical protein